MLFARNEMGEKINAELANRNYKYFCECCGSEVILKRGNVKIPHFAHKSNSECDKWYEMTNWHKEWQEEFPEKFREITVEECGERHRADIKVENLIVEFQHSNIVGIEFDKRNNFYRKSNKLVWLFDLADKDILGYRKPGNKTINFKWKWAYKFNNLDYYGNEFDLFFQVSEQEIIKVVWNKQGFKYFGGYLYTKEGFKNYLRRKLEKIRKDANKYVSEV